ncbi:class I SAM-dependent methyltransferase [Planosporangium sp. 12N6]|uniref:class I SAM-dependent methyltransferase n=1 Tax=Planosporangium spinosum TaxID=3402278 RepID=UPI003CE70D8E
MLDQDMPLLASQQEYYRARAGEYDDTFVPYQEAASGALIDRLRSGQLSGDVLELASGTGYWTTHLVQRCRSLTAVDGSAEMIDTARGKGLTQVEYIHADLFTWEPDRQWDGVFFGHWLSHVPPALFEDFWARVARALRPGGVVEFVDVTIREKDGELIDEQAPDVAVVRTLADGSNYRIVKLFFDAGDLLERLNALGWEGTIDEAAPGFLYGQLRRSRS